MASNVGGSLDLATPAPLHVAPLNQLQRADPKSLPTPRDAVSAAASPGDRITLAVSGEQPDPLGKYVQHTNQPHNDATFEAHVRKIVTDNEGHRPHVYTDTQGHPTVGIGFNLDRSDARAKLTSVGANYDAVRSGKASLNEKQIDAFFSWDLAGAEHDARRLVKNYDQLAPARKGVVTDMIFNLGPGQFAQFKGTIRAIEQGDFQSAAQHMQHSGWYEQTGDRAKRDVARMQTAHW